jgi:hypothetical protein
MMPYRPMRTDCSLGRPEQGRFQRACRKFLALAAGRAWRSTLPSVVGGRPMILSAIAERLKRRSKDDFKGRHF